MTTTSGIDDAYIQLIGDTRGDGMMSLRLRKSRDDDEVGMVSPLNVDSFELSVVVEPASDLNHIHTAFSVHRWRQSSGSNHLVHSSFSI